MNNIRLGTGAKTTTSAEQNILTNLVNKPSEGGVKRILTFRYDR